MSNKAAEYREAIQEELEEILSEARRLVDVLTMAAVELENLDSDEDVDRYKEKFANEIEAFEHISIF